MYRDTPYVYELIVLEGRLPSCLSDKHGDEILPVELTPRVFRGVLTALVAVVFDLDVLRVKGADLSGRAYRAHGPAASIAQ